MTVKKFLERAFYLDKLIEADKRELKDLRELSRSIRSVDLSEDRVQSGGRTDRVAATVAKIVDLERLIQKEIGRYVLAKRKIRNKIDGVTDQRLRLILQERYLRFQSWDEIAELTGYGIRQIFRLRDEALLAVKANEKNGQKTLKTPKA
jgi:hypothetical protein